MASVFVRSVLVLAALAVFALSFGMNALFWWQQFPADLASRSIFVAFSIVAGILKICIPAVAKMHGSRLWRTLAIPFALALVYDVWTGIGYAGMSRDEANRPALSDKAAREDVERRKARAESKLAGLPTSRAVRIIEADLRPAEAEAGPCKSSRAAETPACRKLAALQAERAAAVERSDLEAERDKLAEQLVDAGTPRDSRPHITRVVKGLGGLGLVVSAETLENVWTVLLLGFIEFAPSLVILAMIRLPKPQRDAPAPDVLPLPGNFARPIAKARARSATSGDGVLPYLQAQTPDASGWIVISQRTAAAAIGISPAEVNRQLADLTAAGSITRDPNNRRTAVQLV